jgi:hypothetical protein
VTFAIEAKENPAAMRTRAALVVAALPLLALVPITSRAEATSHAILPSVSGVSPRHGPVNGGTRVTVTGSGFYGLSKACARNTRVAFGASAGDDWPQYARRVRVLSDKKITAVTPPSLAGTVIVTVTNGCGASGRRVGPHFTYRYPTAGTCTEGRCPVRVSRATRGHYRHVASGFVNGRLGGTAPRVARLIAGLRPTAWRIGGPNRREMRLARRVGTSTTLLLEGDWLTCVVCGDLRRPWREPNTFARFIRRDVRHHLADHTAPAYWEVWNEPGNAGTPGQWFRVFDIAYHAIRQAAPHARVIGPSVGAFAVHWSHDGPALAPFLHYAARHHDRFAAVSYHDEGSSGGAPLYSPQGLRAHARRLRHLMDLYRLFRRTRIFVNEYGPIVAMGEPGWIVGDAAVMERSPIAQANYTCATRAACHSTLDGLLTTRSRPRIPYWVFKAYGALHGKLLAGHSRGRNVSVTAARDHRGVVRLLVGRHDDCGAPPRPARHLGAPNGNCAAELARIKPAVSVPVAVHVGKAAHVAKVVVRFFSVASSGRGESAVAIPAPRPQHLRLAVRHGVTHVPALTMLDGDAYEIVVRPAR